jgi:hypothetical protein
MGNKVSKAIKIVLVFTFFMMEANVLTKHQVLAERSFEYRETGHDRRTAE